MVAGECLGLSQVAHGLGLAAVVAAVLVQRQRAQQIARRFLIAAQLPVRDGGVVQCYCCACCVPGLLIQGPGLAEVGKGFLSAAGALVAQADLVQSLGQAPLVPQGPVDLGGVSGQARGAVVPGRPAG